MAVSALKAKPPQEVKPGHTKSLFFGLSGTGKTWLALSFPAPFYVDTEGGADLAHYMERLKRSGGGYLGPSDGSCDFDTIIGQMQALATEKHSYRTLVIDSITKVYQTTIAREAERLGDKDAFGASKKPAIAQMRRFVNWINRIDMNVLCIAHDVPEWGTVGGQRQEIGRTPDVWEKLVYELDLTLKIEKHSPGYRTATVYKSRLTGFPDGERFDIQRNKEDVGYAEFASRYGRDFIEAAPQALVLATVEQCAEIRRLLEVVKVADDAVRKVLDKAGAETWEELNTEQADKTVSWLTGLVAKGATK